MDLVNSKYQYSEKYINAEITDSDDRLHIVPIKYVVGDYFVVKIEDKMFAFTLKNARILLHYKTLTKAYRVVQYDTCHYSSLQPEIKGLELMLDANDLPKMNRMEHNVLRVLGKREKKDFGKYIVKDQLFNTLDEAKKYCNEHELEFPIKHNVHNLDELVKEFGTLEGKYPDEVRNIKNFLMELDTTEIVTPVRKITDFIQEDLIATSPSFLGELLPRYQRMDNEHKKITNTPIKSTKGIMKLVILAIVAVLIVVAIAYASEKGAFDGITSFTANLGTIQDSFQGLPSPTAGFVNPAAQQDKCSDEYIQKTYTPETLKVAVNDGTVDYNCLSETTKKTLDKIEVAP